MALTLLILLLVTLVLVIVGWRDPEPDRRVRLRISSLHYEPKTQLNMTTNLRSPVSQFAQLILAPVDANGKRVKLDEDAIVVDVTGVGARAIVSKLDDDDGGRRFQVSLIPGDEPGESTFTLRGDAQPGEGTEIIEETFVYTTTPNNAVNLGVTVSYLPKTSIPA